MIQFLQISVSLIFFANKVFVLMGKKTGWLLGVIAAILAIFYLYMLELYVFTALEFGLIALMGYGFLVGTKKNLRIERLIHMIIFLVMAVFTYFAFNGMMTIYEFLGSAGLLLGTYFLTHDKRQLGWLLYCVAHLITAYLGYLKGQNFFADFQIASAIISIAGILQVKK